MHLIAEAAGTSQSNLHYHFPTKNDLLLAVLDRLQRYFSEKRSESLDLAHQTFAENLHALFAEKKDDILHHKEVDCVQFDYLVQSTVDPTIRKKMQHTFSIWRQDIARVLRENVAFAKAHPALLAVLPNLIISLLIGGSMQYLLDSGEDDMNLDAYFQQAEDLILRLCDEMPEE